MPDNQENIEELKNNLGELNSLLEDVREKKPIQRVTEDVPEEESEEANKNSQSDSEQVLPQNIRLLEEIIARVKDNSKDLERIKEKQGELNGEQHVTNKKIEELTGSINKLYLENKLPTHSSSAKHSVDHLKAPETPVAVPAKDEDISQVLDKYIIAPRGTFKERPLKETEKLILRYALKSCELGTTPSKVTEKESTVFKSPFSAYQHFYFLKHQGLLRQKRKNGPYVAGPELERIMSESLVEETSESKPDEYAIELLDKIKASYEEKPLMGVAYNKRRRFLKTVLDACYALAREPALPIASRRVRLFELCKEIMPQFKGRNMQTMTTEIQSRFPAFEPEQIHDSDYVRELYDNAPESVFSQRLKGERKLSYGQIILLLALKESADEGVPISDLSEKINFSKHPISIGMSYTTLEKKRGLVEIRKEGGEKLYSLSQKGKELLQSTAKAD